MAQLDLTNENDMLCHLMKEIPHLNESSHQEDWIQIFYQICNLLISGKLSEDQILKTLSHSKIFASERLSIAMCEVLNIIDIETANETPKTTGKNILSITKFFSNFIPMDWLLENLDFSLLTRAGIIKESKVLSQKIIRIKTKLFYKQKKYNIFREECGGYARLVSVLYDFAECVVKENACRPASIDAFSNSIQYLIGNYCLDPNRILAVIINFMEAIPESRPHFAQFLQIYVKQCHTSGLEYVIRYRIQLSSVLDQSLSDVISVLINHGLFSMDMMLDILGSNDDEIELKFKELTDIIQEKRSDLKYFSSIDEKISTRPSTREYIASVKMDENSKSIWMASLIRNRCWDQAKIVMSRFPKNSCSYFISIRDSILEMLSTVFDPFYDRLEFRLSFSKRGAISSLPSVDEIDNDEFYNILDLVLLIGPMLSTSLTLLTKILRVLAHFLKVSPEDAFQREGSRRKFKNYVSMLISEVFLPALSMTHANSALSEECWNVVKFFNEEERFIFYGYWKNCSYSKHATLSLIGAESSKLTKQIIKRVTKENTKPPGRQLGKISHSNPSVVFMEVLDQIKKFGNLIPFVVECLKYLSNLEYDILMYCITESLSMRSEENTRQHVDASISEDLQNVATFCGVLLRKHNLRMTCLLKFLVNQLKDESQVDLMILKEILLKMFGVEVNEEMSLNQIDALCGSDLLKDETGVGLGVKTNKKSSLRLRDALVEADLSLPLYILISQFRNRVVFADSSAELHTKHLGKLYDQCQLTLFQYGRFLHTYMSSESILNTAPTFKSLMFEYNLSSDVIFYLFRPVFSRELKSLYHSKIKSARIASEQSEKLKNSDCFVSAAKELLVIWEEKLSSCFPIKIWTHIKPIAYCVFWLLDSYDVLLPETLYEDAIEKCNKQIVNCDNDLDMSTSKKSKEKERLRAIAQQLNEDKLQQSLHIRNYSILFEELSQNFFMTKSAKAESINMLLHYLFYPRLLFSPCDAVYSAKFILLLHKNKIQNFGTLLCLDRIFSDISCIISSLTENEAHSYGRFLITLFKTCMVWHSSKIVYDKECFNHPGFFTATKSTNLHSVESGRSENFSYEDYRHILFKWQCKIVRSCLFCFKSEDYVKIRNSLIILTNMKSLFPRVVHLAANIEGMVETIIERERESRPDLYVLAVSYLGVLRANKSSMILEEEFHIKPQKRSQTHVPPLVTESGDHDKNVEVSSTSSMLPKKESKHQTPVHPSEPEKYEQMPLESEMVMNTDRSRSVEKKRKISDDHHQISSSSSSHASVTSAAVSDEAVLSYQNELRSSPYNHNHQNASESPVSSETLFFNSNLKSESVKSKRTASRCGSSSSSSSSSMKRPRVESDVETDSHIPKPVQKSKRLNSKLQNTMPVEETRRETRFEEKTTSTPMRRQK